MALAHRRALSPAASVTLTYRVPARRRRSFLLFLRRAFDVYEEPRGVTMRLFESLDEPGLFHEVVEYASTKAYLRDQARVEKDPRVVAVLQEFRAFLSAAPAVHRLRQVRVARRRRSP
ncbi:MAG: hypothetical protein KGJ23_01660 [Euryarchaeota archaeon]|nr:hypothetical protein [Euryarchaeota archaeon]MDE1880573.1 hypothetical protein [Euryarchaeota archaeon]MDE2043598.1 hypothetical protein [Thermoplasmata archaeon]